MEVPTNLDNSIVKNRTIIKMNTFIKENEFMVSNAQDKKRN